MLAVLVASCDERSTLDVRVGAATPGLNGRLELVFDGDIRALSLSDRALVARTADGRVVPTVIDVDGATVGVTLRVDEALVAAPPDAVDVELTGGASVHAIRDRDERRLPTDTTLRWLLDEVLATRRAEPPAVRDVARRDGRLVVVVDGVLDPQTLEPDARAFVHGVDGLPPSEVLARGLSWRVTGEVTEVSLEVPDVPVGTGLQFDPRRVRWADVKGRRLRSAPPFDVDVLADGP